MRTMKAKFVRSALQPDSDAALKMAQGLLGESRKGLKAGDNKKVWLGISSALTELSKLIYDLDPSLSKTTDDLSTKILMKGRS